MEKQGGSFVTGLMLEKLGNGMEEREHQKHEKVASEMLFAGARSTGGHMATSRMTTWRLADP